MELKGKSWGLDSGASKHSPIILLHGMGGTGQLWRPIAARLEDQYTILAPDQRGHGQSQLQDPQEDYSPKSYAQDLLHTIDAHGWDRVWLVGHSMGARTTAAFLELAPHRVQGAVLIDLGFDGLAGGGLGNKLSSFLGDLPKEFPSRQEAKTFLMSKTPDETIALYLLAVAQSNAQGGIHFPFDQGALLKTLEQAKGISIRPWIKEAGAQNIPILVLRGGISKVWSKEDFDQEAKSFESVPNVIFEEVHGAGHGLPFEKREAFTKRLLAFIQKEETS